MNKISSAFRLLADILGTALPINLKIASPPTDMNGKRILIFNWRDMRHKQAGGAEMYISEIARRWVKQGYYVTLFCGNDGSSPREEMMDGIHVVRRGSFYCTYAWAFVYYIFHFRKQYDLIVDCHNGIPFFLPLIAREPIICVVHHVHQEVFKRHLNPVFARFAMFLEAKVMPALYRGKQYVTVSESTRVEMVQLGIDQDDIEIIYNGVDLENLKPGKKSKEPMVLFFGRLQAYKSVDVLIRAFRQVFNKMPDAQLVIAGAGEASADLEILTKELGLTKSIRFSGRVSDEEKVRLMQQAWVSVNPSMMEGWGITTIEANACATPVIGSDVPGLRDSIKHEDTGYLVAYGDAEVLAEHIIKLVDNANLRHYVSRRAHEWAQNFKWDISSDRMLALLNGHLSSSTVIGIRERVADE